MMLTLRRIASRSAPPGAPRVPAGPGSGARRSSAAAAAAPNGDAGGGGSSGFSIQGTFREGRASYLDASATTPLDPRVLDAMMPYMIGIYGNPHSRTHSYGWESETVVEDARAKVASLVGASPKEIVFTSGATESNNISIKGAA